MAKKEFDRISWAIVVVVLHTFFATVVTGYYQVADSEAQAQAVWKWLYYLDFPTSLLYVSRGSHVNVIFGTLHWLLLCGVAWCLQSLIFIRKKAPGHAAPPSVTDDGSPIYCVVCGYTGPADDTRSADIPGSCACPRCQAPAARLPEKNQEIRITQASGSEGKVVSPLVGHRIAPGSGGLLNGMRTGGGATSLHRGDLKMGLGFSSPPPRPGTLPIGDRRHVEKKQQQSGSDGSRYYLLGFGLFFALAGIAMVAGGVWKIDLEMSRAYGDWVPATGTITKFRIVSDTDNEFFWGEIRIEYQLDEKKHTTLKALRKSSYRLSYK
jgi:hypothetical protein